MDDKIGSITLVVSVLCLALGYSSVTLKRSYKPSGRRAISANLLLIACAILLLGLNHVAPEAQEPTRYLVATLALMVCTYPLWRYLFFREVDIPFVPLVAIIYGIYFFAPVFAPFDPYPIFAHSSDEARAQSLHLSLVGVCCMLLTFYSLPRHIWIGRVPRASRVQWSQQRAAVAAFMLGVVGLVVPLVSMSAQIPEALTAILQFVAQFSLLSIAILFYLQLQKQLTIPYVALLWVVIIPVQLVTDISSGFLYPLFRDFMLLLMLYVLVRKRLPLASLGVGIALSLVLLLSKSEFRKVVWTQGSGGPLESASVYMSVIEQTVFAADRDELYEDLAPIVHRFDNGALLGHVVDYTPREVPYWGGETYFGLLWRVVPRVIWQDKPTEGLGQGFGHRYSILDPTDTHTSWNLPQIVELYANFGSVGVILGMGAIGAIYSMLRHILEHKDVGEWNAISAIVVYTALLQVDGNFSLVFGNLMYWIVLLGLLGRLLFPINGKRSHRSNSASWTKRDATAGPIVVR